MVGVVLIRVRAWTQHGEGDPVSLVRYGQGLLQEGHEEITEAVIRKALTLDSSSPVLKEAYRDINERLSTDGISRC